MKSLNKIETPIFVGLCVLLSKDNPLDFICIALYCERCRNDFKKVIMFVAALLSTKFALNCIVSSAEIINKSYVIGVALITHITMCITCVRKIFITRG